MLQLRLIVPPDASAGIVERLVATEGVAHVVSLPAAVSHPPGEVVLCDIAREAANEVIEWLQDMGVHRDGAIVVESLEAVVSDAAERAERCAPGRGANALVWEELEARAREDSELAASFGVLMSIASVIAAIGIFLDAPILIVGAMVVGPEYAPLSSMCVAAARGRFGAAATAARTLTIGLVFAFVAALVATYVFRLTNLAPDEYAVTERELTAFISHPDGLALVVAVLAGVVGMLSLIQARSNALIGVLVSVTTIPAVANVGVATSYGEWEEVAGAALQLALNLVGLIAAGVLTLVVRSRVRAASG